MVLKCLNFAALLLTQCEFVLLCMSAGALSHCTKPKLYCYILATNCYMVNCCYPTHNLAFSGNDHAPRFQSTKVTRSLELKFYFCSARQSVNEHKYFCNVLVAEEVSKIPYLSPH